MTIANPPLVVTSLHIKNDEFPMRIQSWMFWRDMFAGKIPEYKRTAEALHKAGYIFPGTLQSLYRATKIVFPSSMSQCGLCGDFTTRRDEFGYYFCICELLRKRLVLEREAADTESIIGDNVSLDTLKIWGNPKEQDTLRKAFATIKAWVQKPDKWLVLCGPCGSGKSHILAGIRRLWKPWAYYVTANDLSSSIFRSLNEGNGALDKYLDKLKTVPMLLLDDLGIEHPSEIVKNNLNNIFEFRAREPMWQDLITVVTTNYPDTMFESTFQIGGVSRIGSRLRNKEMAIILGFNQTGFDYRVRSDHS